MIQQILALLFSLLVFSIASYAQDNNAIIQNLLTTTRTVTGQEIKLPPKPEIHQIVYTLAPGERLPTHKHPQQRLGYVIEGTIDLIDIANKKTRHFKQGEMLVEMRNQWHYGINNDTSTTKLLIVDVTPADTTSNVTLENGADIPYPSTQQVIKETIVGQDIFVPRTPEIRSSIYEIAAKTNFPMHKHLHPRMFYILSGEIDVIDGESHEIRKLKSGEFLVEAIDRLHYGENNAAEPVRILVIDFVPVGSPSNTALHDALVSH
jgi:quercetin dioxygenase-like cupin family protein